MNKRDETNKNITCIFFAHSQQVLTLGKMFCGRKEAFFFRKLYNNSKQYFNHEIRQGNLLQNSEFHASDLLVTLDPYVGCVILVWFYGISTTVGYLMPSSFSYI